MKIRKGFTLLEVILTLAILLIVISFPTRFFLFGSQVQKLSADETEIQASTRLISEHINYITRFATKTHSIPKSSFQYSEDGVRDPYTSYIGITKNGHVVIDKPGEEEDDPRIVEYVAKKQPGIDYEIIFDQEMYDKDGESSNGEEEKLDTVLSFSIVGKKDNKVVTEVISSVELLNSINIDHLGTDSDPAVALAFSMVEPGSQEWVEVSPDAYITMVLDISGSMNWDMDGKSESVTNPRIDILKSNANKMIDRLANMNFDIYVCLVPFSTSANNPGDFYNVNDEEDLNDLKNEVDVLTANGATNTGDGIRRAYHQLKNITDPLIEDGKSYSDFTQHMMVLVDGATNRESRERVGWFGSKYFLGDGNVYSGWFANPYINSISNNDNDYVAHLGEYLIKNHTYTFEEETKQVINTFVIGFSNVEDDQESLEDIGNAINGKSFEDESGEKRYIIATNAGELDFAFGQFETEVENSLWVITRPKLRP